MMNSRIFRQCRRILLVVGFSVLSGCSVYEHEERYFEGVIEDFVLFGYGLWNRITTREVTVEEVREIFAEHQDVMMSIVQTCEQYPGINIISTKYTYFPGEDEVGPEMAAVLELIRSKMAEIPASKVVCARWQNIGTKPLGGVSFVVYAGGLSRSGKSKSIVYRTEWLQKNSPLTEEQLDSHGYIELLDKGWYILVSVEKS